MTVTRILLRAAVSLALLLAILWSAAALPTSSERSTPA